MKKLLLIALLSAALAGCATYPPRRTMRQPELCQLLDEEMQLSMCPVGRAGALLMSPLGQTWVPAMPVVMPTPVPVPTPTPTPTVTPTPKPTPTPTASPVAKKAEIKK